MVVANFQLFHLSRHPAHRTTKIAIQFLLLISSEIHFPYILWKRGSDFLNEKGVALYSQYEEITGFHVVLGVQVGTAAFSYRTVSSCVLND